ncbi:anti-sigma factor domain-containing protein [Frateuria sp. GZRR35]|uniref:anti-sigma factor n=1 Tax=Frateuria sp. GZRR35 TaxID=3351536 RepID=UPI003EDBDBD9
MATTPDNRDELRHAEYVLGVLDAHARAAVEQEVRSDAAAAQAVLQWQRHLTSMAEDVPEVAPPAYVWARILHSLGLTEAAPRSAPERSSWWDSLNLWRWVGIGASLVAAAAIVFTVLTPRAPTPVVAPAGYMVATIAQDNGQPGWTATMDPQHARMVVVPAAPPPVQANRSTELWLIPPGEKPISLGVFPTDRPTTLRLSPAIVARLSNRALLAVSVEPPGGSPTGQPTGPVIAKGAIAGA